MAVAITPLMGGLVIGPVTQQSAEAQVYGGLKSAGTTGGAIGENNLILVGHGGGHGGGHWGGGHGGGHVAHGGGRGGHGHGGRAYARNWHHGGGGHHAGKGHKNYYAHNYNHYRYYRYGRYYRNYRWYGGAYAYGYGYGNCAWLRRQALITNSPYWWNRYYSCIN